MTLLPQTPHGSILLLNSLPSDPLTINFVFLVLTFIFLLPSASFQLQNLSFKLTMSSLAHLEQPKFPITANLLIFAQYRIFALGINLKAFLFSKVNYFRIRFPKFFYLRMTMEPWPPWQTPTFHLKIPCTRACRMKVRYSKL